MYSGHVYFPQGPTLKGSRSSTRSRGSSQGFSVNRKRKIARLHLYRYRMLCRFIGRSKKSVDIGAGIFLCGNSHKKEYRHDLPGHIQPGKYAIPLPVRCLHPRDPVRYAHSSPPLQIIRILKKNLSDGNHLLPNMNDALSPLSNLN